MVSQIQPEDPLIPHPLPPEDFNRRELPVIINTGTWLRLSQDKILARQQLLQLSPQAAQSALNSVIDPALFQPDFSQGSEFNSWSLVDDMVED